MGWLSREKVPDTNWKKSDSLIIEIIVLLYCCEGNHAKWGPNNRGHAVYYNVYTVMYNWGHDQLKQMIWANFYYIELLEI